MIIEKKTYFCTKCHYHVAIQTSEDTGINNCPKCKNILTHKNTYLFNTETNRVTEYLYHAQVNQKNLQSQLKSKPVVTCPYCKSTNVHKISGIGKAASIGLFGIFALPGASKQFHCKDCKADF